jgi:hypothetical protein
MPAHSTCPECGHRLALHGLLMRDVWCIAWDGFAFCGCQTRCTPQVDEDYEAARADLLP